MAARAQSAARIYGLAGGERGTVTVDHQRPLARPTQAKPLVEHQLGGSHGVMQLDRLELARANPGLLVSGKRGRRRRIWALVVNQSVFARTQHTARDLDRFLARETRCAVGYAEDRRGRAVGYRGTHQ